MPSLTVSRKIPCQYILLVASKAFDTRYDIPSRNYFLRTALPSLYSTTKERVAAEIQQVRFFLLPLTCGLV